MTPDPRLVRLRGRHVVVANWRDPAHPQAGGAETYAREVAEGLSGAGVRVTYLTARHRGARRTEHHLGVTYRRRGGRFTVYAWVLVWLLVHRRQVDHVLDCQNGLPFFAPLVVRRRTGVTLLVHHVHTDQFALHFPRPLVGLGRLLEGPVSRRVYRHRAVIAVSPSTRQELRSRLRFRSPVWVIPNGVRTTRTGPRRRSDRPVVVVVGRMVAQKRWEQLVEAVALLRPERPDLTVVLAGDGPARAQLAALVAARGLSGTVSLPGRVSDAVRDDLFGRAWLTVSVSDREGWGLSVIEAAAHGVPALVRDVPGVRDAVLDASTGWLVSPAGVSELATSLGNCLDALADPRLAARFDLACRARAARFQWPDTTARVAGVLAGSTRPRRAGRPRRSTDQAVIVEGLAAGAEAYLSRARAILRCTDSFGVTPAASAPLAAAEPHEAPVGAWMLGYGLDERDAALLACRLGLSNARCHVATGEELLLGHRDPPFPELDAGLATLAGR